MARATLPFCLNIVVRNEWPQPSQTSGIRQQREVLVGLAGFSGAEGASNPAVNGAVGCRKSMPVLALPNRPRSDIARLDAQPQKPSSPSDFLEVGSRFGCES